MAITGSEIVTQTLKKFGTEVFFFIMGGPMLQIQKGCLDLGIRGIDVRHEQAAAFMAHAYSRVSKRPGVCMAASGPGTTNLVTGIANAYVDRVPVVALGGSSPVWQYGMGAFQEVDQLSVMQPITRWSARVHDPRRIPEMLATAFRHALSGRPGPVYLDLPGDVLARGVDEASVRWHGFEQPYVPTLPPGDPALVEAAVALLARAERPVILSGSGVLWGEAADSLQRWVDATGIPLYTTPQGRGVIPDDHALSLRYARSVALREADVVLVVGTRLNYVVGFAGPPRVSRQAKLVHVDAELLELGHNRVPDVGIVGNIRSILNQLIEASHGVIRPRQYAAWVDRLSTINEKKRVEQEAMMQSDEVPIHPLRLCKELRDIMPRDAILVVDGREILAYGRYSLPTYFPGHRLNSGTLGTMGVGAPYGIGAKVARPDKPVFVLHGDGSFGMSAMELDTAVRHNIPVTFVISLNGGWTGDPNQDKPGRNLGYTRFDLIAQALGCWSAHVETPDQIRPALEQAVESGKPALVNVVTDFRAVVEMAPFSQYST